MKAWFLLFLMFFVPLAQSKPIKINTDLVIQQYNAEFPVAHLVWFPSEYGVLPEEIKIAKKLAKQGVSVVIPDMFASYFLPSIASSLNKVPLQDVVNLINQLKNKTPNIPLFVLTSNLSSANVIKALVSIQSSAVSNIGLILLNPNLYVKTPKVGEKAIYWQATSLLNMPVYILQAELSPWKWQLGKLKYLLQKSGSSVFVQLKEQVRDRYYFRPDALEVEKENTINLASDVIVAMQRLLPYLAENRMARKVTKPLLENKTAEKVDLGIANYTGEQNLPIKLEDMQGIMHNLQDYMGKVVLLNFWASWCPPCVHEIPSMVRLKKHFKEQKFEILAVNLAENKAKVTKFLETNGVNFPILLDANGLAVKDWKVFAYPSTYLIDKDGKIRFAVFGGYDWDSATSKNKINRLLSEKVNN